MTDEEIDNAWINAFNALGRVRISGDKKKKNRQSTINPDLVPGIIAE